LTVVLNLLTLIDKQKSDVVKPKTIKLLFVASLLCMQQ